MVTLVVSEHGHISEGSGMEDTGQLVTAAKMGNSRYVKLLCLSSASSGTSIVLGWRGGALELGFHPSTQPSSCVSAGKLPATGEPHLFNIRMVISTALNNYEDSMIHKDTSTALSI